jgi:DNA ligase-1
MKINEAKKKYVALMRAVKNANIFDEKQTDDMIGKEIKIKSNGKVGVIKSVSHTGAGLKFNVNMTQGVNQATGVLGNRDYYESEIDVLEESIMEEDVLDESVEDNIEAIKSVKGKQKVAALQALTQDKLTQEIFHYAYNPFKMFGVNALSGVEFKGNKTINQTTWNEYKKILDLMATRDLTGSEARNRLKEFLSKFNPTSGTIFLYILEKDLRIGLGAKTLNKVFKKLIPEFDVILADKFDVHGDFKLPFAETYASRKLDGYRLIGIKKDDTIELLSREGVKQNKFPEIQEQLLSLPGGNKVFDGEVVKINEKDVEDFTGIMSARGADADVSQVKYLIFDCLGTDEFLERKVTKGFNDRYAELKKILGITKIDNPNAWLVKTKYPNIMLVNQVKIISPDHLKELFLAARKMKYEGIMIRPGDTPYEFKRTKNLLKLKEMDDDEFTIVGYIEGKKGFANKGMMGAFYADVGGVNDKGKRNIVEVGSGLNFEQRKEFWTNLMAFEKKHNLHPVVKADGESDDRRLFDEYMEKNGITDSHPYVGKTITVKFQERTKNKAGGKSVRFPIFKGIGREDVEGEK